MPPVPSCQWRTRIGLPPSWRAIPLSGLWICRNQLRGFRDFPPISAPRRPPPARMAFIARSCNANDALADGGQNAYVAAMIRRTIPLLLLLAVPAFAANKPAAKPAPKPVTEQPITVDGLLTQSRAALA